MLTGIFILRICKIISYDKSLMLFKLTITLMVFLASTNLTPMKPKLNLLPIVPYIGLTETFHLMKISSSIILM